MEDDGPGDLRSGVEPADCDSLGGRAAIRELCQLPMLEPGESRAYHIDLDIISDTGDQR